MNFSRGHAGSTESISLPLRELGKTSVKTTAIGLRCFVSDLAMFITWTNHVINKKSSFRLKGHEWILYDEQENFSFKPYKKKSLI